MTAGTDPLLNQIVNYARANRFDDLDPDVAHQAKVRVIDTLGAALAGFDGHAASIARTLALRSPSTDGATIIGTDLRVLPEMAAYANAIASRSAEMMDVYHYPGSFGGHPSDVVLPLVAVAETVGASGRDLILAVAVAYEIFLNISDNFENVGFDDTNFSAIAVAAVSARLWGSSEKETSNAIAMAAVANVILKQVRTDALTEWKVIATGHAGRAGVFSVLQAKAGMEAPNLPFVGKAGWCSQVAREAFQLDRLMPSSRPRKILDTRIKHRPAAGETISSIIAAEKIAKACRTPDEITAIRVDLYKRALVRAATGDHHWHPESRDAAANSIPYLVATTILDGTISLHSFSDEKISWPRTQDLLSKITVHEDGVFTKAYNKTPVGHWTRITVRMKDGSVLKAETGDDEDDLSAPRTDAQIDAKFRQLAGSRLQVSALERALSTLWDLDTCSNIAPILEMLRMDHDQPARPDAIPTPGGAQR